MNRLVDKLKKKITINHKMFLFLFILFIIGLITGSLFVTILKESDQTLIKDSLSTFFNGITKNTLGLEKTFVSSLLSQILSIFMIWLLGISIIGIPIVIILYFSKAFTLGFSIGSILFHYKLKGILLAIGYIFPHHILNFIVYTILSIYSLSLSMKLLNALLHKKKIDFHFILNKYLFILIFSLVGIILSTTFETLVMPKVMKFILDFVS